MPHVTDLWRRSHVIRTSEHVHSMSRTVAAQFMSTNGWLCVATPRRPMVSVTGTERVTSSPVAVTAKLCVPTGVGPTPVGGPTRSSLHAETTSKTTSVTLKTIPRRDGRRGITTIPSMSASIPNHARLRGPGTVAAPNATPDPSVRTVRTAVAPSSPSGVTVAGANSHDAPMGRPSHASDTVCPAKTPRPPRSTV